jgi:hypothetical protein
MCALGGSCACAVVRAAHADRACAVMIVNRSGCCIDKKSAIEERCEYYYTRMHVT